MRRILLALALASSAVSAGQLTAENGVEFLAINGKAAEKFGNDADKRVTLSPGVYQIVLRYEDEVKRGSKNLIYTSKPYALDIDVTDADLAISVPTMRFESQADAFFRSPEWQVANLSTNSVKIMAGEELTGAGFGAFSNIERAIANHNSEKGIIFEQGEVKDLEEVLVSVDDKGKVDITGDTVTQLKLWYTKASNEEKKAFKRWMIDQDF